MRPSTLISISLAGALNVRYVKGVAHSAYQPGASATRLKGRPGLSEHEMAPVGAISRASGPLALAPPLRVSFSERL